MTSPRLPAAQRLLAPPLGNIAPISDLERMWLESSCYYAVFDDNVMEDTLWDKMAVELWERKHELSPYFTQAVGLQWPVLAADYEVGENPLKTAMGVDWSRDLPAIVVEGIRKDGPKRLAMWRSRIEAIRKEALRSPYSAKEAASMVLPPDPSGSL